MLISDGTVLGLCANSKQLLGIREGRKVFGIEPEQGVSMPFAEDEGSNFYRLDSTPIYDEKRIIRTRADGQQVWSMKFKLTISTEAVMNPDGTIYVFGTGPAAPRR
ncbi:MAG: hypothetical protein QM757_29420 [Paludibaculum sp.]